MKKFTPLIMMFILLLLGGVIVFVISQINSSLEIEDSDALFGGRFEFGYTSAGFLVNVNDDSRKTCGAAVVSVDTAVTAAHCVDGAKDIFIGKELFNGTTSELIKVDKAVQKVGWIDGKNRADDIAVLSFKGVNYFKSFAQVATPIEGCFYRIVAYGRTELSDEFNKPRKSSKLCSFDLTRDTFKVKGDDSGICFGDSGSPVYFEETNKLVGVIASIILENPEDPNPCAFGNTAIVVRTDSNASLIDNSIQNPPTEEEIIQGQSLTIEVAEEDFIGKLGLDYFRRLTSEQKNLYYLAATSVVVTILLILLLIRIFRPRYLDHK